MQHVSLHVSLSNEPTCRSRDGDVSVQPLAHFIRRAHACSLRSSPLRFSDTLKTTKDASVQHPHADASSTPAECKSRGRPGSFATARKARQVDAMVAQVSSLAAENDITVVTPRAEPGANRGRRLQHRQEACAMHETLCQSGRKLRRTDKNASSNTSKTLTPRAQVVDVGSGRGYLVEALAAQGTRLPQHGPHGCTRGARADSGGDGGGGDGEWNVFHREIIDCHYTNGFVGRAVLGRRRLILALH